MAGSMLPLNDFCCFCVTVYMRVKCSSCCTRT